MVTTTRVVVSLPLLRAIEHLPDVVEIDGITLRFTGQVTSAPIVRGFAAHRALVVSEHGDGYVDLTSASSWRSEMTLQLKGVSAARAEQLLLTLRSAMVASTESPAEATSDERIDVCRTA
ncbi:MAG: hypothetical protein QOC92_476 [Acidimicrobiaceae bacterium]|jgi:hypothetical protein